MEQLEMEIKLKEEVWNGIQKGWKRQEEGWKSKEEAWKMMESMWKSNYRRTEMQGVLPPLVIDALVQTENVPRKNKFCQTVKSDSIDFQVQVTMEPERKMTGTQTIKEEDLEIAFPNRPSSNSSLQTKKRKLSAIQTAPRNVNAGLSVDIPSSMSSHQKQQTSENRTQRNETATLNESVLESKVYKIYCQHEDPQVAMTKIKQMNQCSKFIEAKMKSSWEVLNLGFESIFEATSKKLEEYNLILNIYEAIAKFKIQVDNEGKAQMKQKKSGSKKQTITIGQLFMNSLTKIILIQPNGYEVWLIRDFYKGSGVSKWYRGFAYTVNGAARLAKMNALGIKIPAGDETSETVSWLSFAKGSMNHSPKGLVCQRIIYSLTVG